MLTEAALLLRDVSSVSVRTFVIPFYYGSGSAKQKVGSYGSGSATLVLRYTGTLLLKCNIKYPFLLMRNIIFFS